MRSKATFSLLFSLLSFLWKRQFERKEKSEKLRVKRPKRNDNLLSKTVVSFWRRRRDSNPRDAFDTYTISNRAPSAGLGDFSEYRAPKGATHIIILICQRFVNLFFLLYSIYFSAMPSRRSALPWSIISRSPSVRSRRLKRSNSGPKLHIGKSVPKRNLSAPCALIKSTAN